MFETCFGNCHQATSGTRNESCTGTKKIQPMFKKPILMLALLACSVSLFSQKWSLDGRFGMTLSTFRSTSSKKPSNEDAYPNYLLGVGGGIGGQYAFNSRFSLGAGLHYTQKGFSTGRDQDFRFHYVALPVWANYRVWKGISVQAGVETGRLLSAIAITPQSSIDITKIGDFGRTDVGLFWGVEVAIHRNFFVNLREVIGLSRVFDLDYTNAGGETDIRYNRNVSIQLSAVYRFGLKEHEKTAG
jgi:hypothetical protein